MMSELAKRRCDPLFGQAISNVSKGDGFVSEDVQLLREVEHLALTHQRIRAPRTHLAGLGDLEGVNPPHSYEEGKNVEHDETKKKRAK